MTAGDKNAQYVEKGHCWDMGYEIIHREDESEITRQEIEAFADFHIQEGLTGTNPKTAELVTLGGEFVISVGHPDVPNGVPFLYSGRHLKVSNPDESTGVHTVQAEQTTTIHRLGRSHAVTSTAAPPPPAASGGGGGAGIERPRRAIARARRLAPCPSLA